MSEKITLEKLAIMIKNGFDETGEKITGVETRLTGVEGRLTGVEGRLTGVETRLTGVEKKLDDFQKVNTREHEEMSLRLDNVAYRFELVALTQRVEKLEKIANISKSKI
jgi:hypothetical protein